MDSGVRRPLRPQPAQSSPPYCATSLLGLDEGSYLLKALSSVRATELEQALLLLPFHVASDLLTRLLALLPPHADDGEMYPLSIEDASQAGDRTQSAAADAPSD